MAGRPKLNELSEAIELLGGDAAVADMLLEHGTITAVARELGVSRIMMYWWMRQDPKRQAAFKSLREVIATNMLDEIMDIVDEQPDINPLTGSIDSGWVANNRLKIDTRKWIAARYNPEYNDKAPSGEITPDTVNTLRELFEAIRGTGSQRLVGGPERVIDGEVVPTFVSQPLMGSE